MTELHNTTETAQELPSVEQLRGLFSDVMSRPASDNQEIRKMVKVFDLGETKELMVDTMSHFASLSKKKEQSTAGRWLREKVPGFSKLLGKTEEGVDRARFEGKSVAEVSSNLIEAVTSKRDRVTDIFEKLTDLNETMRGTYFEMDAIVKGIDENYEQYSEKEQFHLNNIKVDVLQSMAQTEQNINAASAAITGAKAAQSKINNMIPDLRAQLDDAMAIRGALNELEEMTDLCDVITSACVELRSENQEVVEEQLIGILDRSVITDKQLALIDQSAERSRRFEGRLQSKLAEVSNRRKLATTKLQDNLDTSRLLGKSDS